MRDFELSLQKLFAEAYPKEEADRSSVFLGHFVSGLRSDIARQVLLCGAPDTLDTTIRNTTRIERALGFDEGQQQVRALKAEGRDDLREILDKVMSRMESLELHLQERKPAKARGFKPPRCYHCNEEGHIRCYCPLRRRTDDPETSEVCYCNSASLRVHGTLGGQNVLLIRVLLCQ